MGLRVKLILLTSIVAGVCFLLLSATGQSRAPKMPKDNSGCLVCHINFETEKIAVTHLKKGMTCAKCHGISYEHMNDEECAAKPDILYGRAQVEPMCKKCHRAHKDPKAVAKFMSEWKGKRRPQGRLILANAICTDCHGLHRLPRGGAHAGSSSN